MRATEVKHTSLKADFTNPVTQLQGDGNGKWINHPVEVTAIAHDALSGMTDTDEFPDDAPPATFVQVDGQPVVSSVGATSSAQVGREGEHQVKFWGRDLAGNTDATPRTAPVRIDETDPRAAFTNGQDPDDPDKLVAPVSDALSGVVTGTISYRQAGGSSWKALDTALRYEQLIARVDSGDMRPGVTYEFRAQATDKAGNTVSSNRKQNGELMKVVGPFGRSPTSSTYRSTASPRPGSSTARGRRSPARWSVRAAARWPAPRSSSPRPMARGRRPRRGRPSSRPTATADSR